MPKCYDLEISVHEGKGLAAKDKTWYGKKKSSDPYVELRLCSLGADTPEEDKVYLGKTDPVMKTLDPVWDPLSFTVSLPTHYFSKEGSYFECTIYDWNEDDESELMGVVPVIIPTQHHTVLKGDPLTTTKWYGVPALSANGERATGSLLCTLQVQKVDQKDEAENEAEESEAEEAKEGEDQEEEGPATWGFDTPEAKEQQLPNRTRRGGGMQRLARKSIAVRSHSVMLNYALGGRTKTQRSTSPPIPEEESSVVTAVSSVNIEMLDLELTVVRAKGLLAMDNNFIGMKTASDPYVEVRLCPIGALQEEETKLFLGKTNIVHKNLSPVWEQTFTASLPKKDFSQFAMLELKLLDHDEGEEDDLLGVVPVHIPIGRSGTTSKWYDVPASTAQEGEEATGHIECILTTKKRRVGQNGEAISSSTSTAMMKPSYKMEPTTTTAAEEDPAAVEPVEEEEAKPQPTRSRPLSDFFDGGEEEKKEANAVAGDDGTELTLETPKSSTRRQRRADRKREGTGAPLRRTNTSSGSLGSSLSSFSSNHGSAAAPFRRQNTSSGSLGGSAAMIRRNNTSSGSLSSLSGPALRRTNTSAGSLGSLSNDGTAASAAAPTLRRKNASSGSLASKGPALRRNNTSSGSLGSLSNHGTGAPPLRRKNTASGIRLAPKTGGAALHRNETDPQPSATSAGPSLRRTNTSSGRLAAKAGATLRHNTTEMPNNNAGTAGAAPLRRTATATPNAGTTAATGSAPLRRMNTGQGKLSPKASAALRRQLSPVRRNNSSDNRGSRSGSLSPMRGHSSAGDLSPVRPSLDSGGYLKNQRWIGAGKDRSLSPVRSLRSPSPMRKNPDYRDSFVFCSQKGHFVGRAEAATTTSGKMESEALTPEERAEQKIQELMNGTTDSKKGLITPDPDRVEIIQEGLESRGGGREKEDPNGAANNRKSGRRRGKSSNKLPKKINSSSSSSKSGRGSSPRRRGRSTGRLPSSKSDDIEADGTQRKGDSPPPRRRRGRSTGRLVLNKSDDESDAGAASKQQRDSNSPGAAGSSKSPKPRRRPRSTGRLPKIDDETTTTTTTGGNNGGTDEPPVRRRIIRVIENEESQSPTKKERTSRRTRRAAKRSETMGGGSVVAKSNSSGSLGSRRRKSSSNELRLLDSSTSRMDASSPAAA